ncbi:helix-turn-helix transcriptional regulator [Skermania sp. ID1734]|uniref:TetR/AcrR family transcriptional regulator n=1 Tax=Skermania sp. ID1734 TaxID=2597516 RepID=UPI001180A247|nr:helix-turn-helix transcriptional regulator [Skermania sp. ID1734]
MQLFSEKGFRGTSITQIEAAAGLTPGAGGIYHHFRTKDALLRAGIARHLDRLAALRDIRELLTGLGDLRVELTLLARYALREMTREQDLLRVLATEARTHPELVNDAVDQLIRSTFAGFATWLETQGVPAERSLEVSTVGLGALLSNRLLQSLHLLSATDVTDEAFVRTWVHMMERTIQDIAGA